VIFFPEENDSLSVCVYKAAFFANHN